RGGLEPESAVAEREDPRAQLVCAADLHRELDAAAIQRGELLARVPGALRDIAGPARLEGNPHARGRLRDHAERGSDVALEVEVRGHREVLCGGLDRGDPVDRERAQLARLV